MSRSSSASSAPGSEVEGWLREALDYLPGWLAFQLRQSEGAGAVLAVAHRGELVLEHAVGAADLATGEALTPRHRFRIASHSKTFTAAGVMRLREAGRLSLDDAIGRYVPGLHPEVAEVTLGQLLSHSAGVTRDGSTGGQFLEDRPYASREEVLADLARGPTIPPNTRFKYSNHGFALAGMAIEAVTGEPYAHWIAREVVAPFGLGETTPDVPVPAGAPFALGHTGKWPLGRRAVIPGENRCHAITPAAGFVSTAADLVRFLSRLSPEAAESPLSVASRREMARRQWRNPDTGVELWYGLGTVSGSSGPWSWFGHSGRFQGYVSRSCVVPGEELSVSVLVNAGDGLADLWAEGVLQVLRAARGRGAPAAALRDWRGRWWSIGGAVDLLPLGERVVIATPAFSNPMLDASEIEVTGPDEGRIALAPGFGSQGERVRLVRDAAGVPVEFWIGGMRLRPEAALKAEMERSAAVIGGA
jgi:CubicO group peptidase (beta-lactamase class C family)